MKRLTLALWAALFTAQLALAQQLPPRPPLRGGPPIEMMAKQLGLDDTQKVQVKQILEQERARQEPSVSSTRPRVSGPRAKK